MAAFRCAEEGGGCGVVFTPDHDRRPVNPETASWAWCPDCRREHVNGEGHA